MKLHRQKPEFCLLSADTTPAYKITILDAILYVKKIELTLSVFNAINTVLNGRNAQHAITRTTPKVFTVPREQQSQHTDNAFLGAIPKRIAICMMDNDSYNEKNSYNKKNPFNFQHYNLTQIGISVNGEEVPFKTLKLNFDDKLIVTAYNTIFSGTGKLHGKSGSVIKREDFQRDTRSLLQILHHLRLVIIDDSVKRGGLLALKLFTMILCDPNFLFS